MRGARINQLERPINPSFLSCEKDAESIVRKLFVESKPYSDELKRLMLINTKDCLIDRTNPAYLNKIKSMSVAELRRNQYVRLSPKLSLEENEEVKSYLVITFDDFSNFLSFQEFVSAFGKIIARATNPAGLRQRSNCVVRNWYS